MTQLSIGVTSFAAEDPGTWQPLFDAAPRRRRGRRRPARRVRPRGVRRAARGVRPARDRRAGRRQAADRSRRPLAGAADHVVGARGDDVARPSRHQHPRRRAAPSGGARQDDGDPRRALGRSPRPRRRRRLAARGVRRRRPRLRPAAAACSTTPSRCARPCGASSGRPTTRPSSSFEATHMMPKPLQPGGVPVWVSGTINPRVVRRLARFGSGWIPWGRGRRRPRRRHRRDARAARRGRARPGRASR